MCRGFDQNGTRNYDEVLKIKAFYVRLLYSTSTTTNCDSLTLHFPPRINGGLLDIDGFSVRPDTPAFVTLHRVVVTSAGEAAVLYCSRERLRVSEGVRFEIYASDVKVLKGIVRKDEGEGENWRLDCKAHEGELLLLSEADMWVEKEGLAEVMTEKVEIVEKRRTKTRTRSGMGKSLEEIPEQRESESEFDGCFCCCCGDDGKATAEWRCREVVDGGGEVDECEVEGVRWAVDVGIWVVCLGVGYLVSKASRNNRISIRMQRRLF